MNKYIKTLTFFIIIQIIFHLSIFFITWNINFNYWTWDLPIRAMYLIVIIIITLVSWAIWFEEI